MGHSMSDTQWQRSDAWVGATVEDSFVMINIDSGHYVSLNATADAVWRALETPRTSAEICDLLLAQFDVSPETCARSVSVALDTMRDRNLARPLQP